jgi:hypothetical protein
MRVRHFVLSGKLGVDDEVSEDRVEWRRLGAVAEVLPLEMRPDAGLDIRPDRARDSRGAWRPVLLAMLVIAVFTGTVYVIGEGDEAPGIDCAAPPAAGMRYDGCRLSAVEWPGVSLGGSVFASANLAGAILSGADLSAADLRYAALAGADLSYTDLSGAVLKGADLTSSDLTNADLSQADLSFADLSRARIGGAVFDGARLDGTIWADGRECTAGGCPR